jgi:hypothetical protein
MSAFPLGILHAGKIRKMKERDVSGYLIETMSGLFWTEMNCFDCTLVFNRVFDFDHEIGWDNFHIMIRVHVLDDLFCNLTFVHSGSLE